MMGRHNRDQGQLFYSFDLDAAVPRDHLVREIAAVLDLSWVYDELALPRPSIGRPSIDLVLMLRMLIIGYVFGMRSSSREAFDYHEQQDIYICPAGKRLKTSRTLVNGGATLLYRASNSDCGRCPLKPKCCPRSPQRKVPRDMNEAAREVARAIARTQQFAQTRRDRKKVEMLFAHLKRILRLGRLRLRGPRGAQFEFTLAATAQNLRRLGNLIARPPPLTASYAA